MVHRRRRRCCMASYSPRRRASLADRRAVATRRNLPAATLAVLADLFHSFSSFTVFFNPASTLTFVSSLQLTTLALWGERGMKGRLQRRQKG